MALTGSVKDFFILFLAANGRLFSRIRSTIFYGLDLNPCKVVAKKEFLYLCCLGPLLLDILVQMPFSRPFVYIRGNERTLFIRVGPWLIAF